VHLSELREKVKGKIGFLKLICEVRNKTYPPVSKQNPMQSETKSTSHSGAEIFQQGYNSGKDLPWSSARFWAKWHKLPDRGARTFLSASEVRTFLKRRLQSLGSGLNLISD